MLKIFGETYYSTAEVCKIFGISRNTWDRWRKLYGVKHVSLGQRRFFSNGEMKHLLERAIKYGVTPRRKEEEE